MGAFICCTTRQDVLTGKIGLITPDALKLKLEDKITPVTVIDCRRGKEAALVEKSYTECHIPGAFYLNMS